MRRSLPLTAQLLVVLSTGAAAQVAGKFPPDSLINVQVIPKGIPVTQVVGQMRNITFALGVRCPFCHVGEEGRPLAEFDFASDEKPTKVTARQMMRMVEEVNRRLDTIPSHSMPHVEVTCRTCHRGVERPIPLSTMVIQATLAGGADSGIGVYRGLREKYYGRDAYDFGESSLSIAAFRVAREQKFEDALVILGVNEELFPGSSAMSVFRGNIQLMRGDTTAAAASFREAVQRDSTNGEARGRLRDIGQVP